MTAFGRGPNVATSPRQMTWSTPVRQIFRQHGAQCDFIRVDI
jgi:hypothetical protein